MSDHTWADRYSGGSDGLSGIDSGDSVTIEDEERTVTDTGTTTYDPDDSTDSGTTSTSTTNDDNDTMSTTNETAGDLFRGTDSGASIPGTGGSELGNITTEELGVLDDEGLEVQIGSIGEGSGSIDEGAIMDREKQDDGSYVGDVAEGTAEEIRTFTQDLSISMGSDPSDVVAHAADLRAREFGADALLEPLEDAAEYAQNWGSGSGDGGGGRSLALLAGGVAAAAGAVTLLTGDD